MISRSTVIGGLVVVELAILGVAASALGSGGPVFAGAPAGIRGPWAGGFRSRGTATTRLDRTFLTGPVPRVVVDVADLHVSVETANVPTVRVVETLALHGWTSGAPAALVAEQTPDGVRVHTSGEDTLQAVFGGYLHDLRIVVPSNARVQLATSDRIDVSGLRAKLIAHSSDGSIHVRDHLGDVDVSTNSGRVELVDVHGTAIDASSRDGRIYLTRVGADRLVAHSDFGRIVGEGVRAVDGSLTTADGRVIVSFTADSDAIAKVHTDDDDISVTGFTSVPSGDRTRTVTLGSGRGHFDISTASGPIRITQGANS